MDHHPHIHALVLGGGPALEGSEWVTSTHPNHRRRQKPYLADNRALGKLFREKFILGLHWLVEHGKLKLDGARSDLVDRVKLDEFIEDLRSTD